MESCDASDERRQKSGTPLSHEMGIIKLSREIRPEPVNECNSKE